MAIYYSFTYMGFPTSAVLASVGLATLALTLGAQGMVADVITGVAIVFEGAFQVGDIVELEGFWGKVEEIGIRTTKLVNKDNDVKIIENSQIKNLISKTKYYSRCVVTMTVSAQESLLRIEGVLSEYLPQIGQKYADILSGPEFIGVSQVGIKNIVPYIPSMELMIIAECKEENKDAVIRNLNRELIILFEEKNIRMI